MNQLKAKQKFEPVKFYAAGLWSWSITVKSGKKDNRNSKKTVLKTRLIIDLAEIENIEPAAIA